MNNKKKVLITGAAGFIGRNTARYFKDLGWEVFGIGLGRLNRNEVKRWGIDRFLSAPVILRNLRKGGQDFDLIVHCAGSGSVGKSFADPIGDFGSNVGSVLEVLEFARSIGKKIRVILLSSPAVYGEKPNKPIRESAPLQPVSPYGLHKKIAEELGEFYSRQHGVDISIIRLFSIYGPGLEKQLLWDGCEKIRRGNGSAEFFGTGNETRDWLHVRDVAALIYVLEKSGNKFEIVNGGSGKAVKIRKVLELLVQVYGKKIKLKFIGQIKKGDPRYYWADNSDALAKGWKPEVGLKEGIKEFVVHYRQKYD